MRSLMSGRFTISPRGDIMSEVRDWKSMYEAQAFVIERLVALKKKHEEEVEALWNTIHRQRIVLAALQQEEWDRMQDGLKYYIERKQDNGT